MDDTQRDTRAIEAIRERLEAAENTGNTDVLAEMVAEDVVMMVPDFPVQEGKTACVEFFGELLPALLAQFNRRISYVSAEIAVLGDMAFDRGSFAFTVSPKTGGDTEHVTGKYFWLLRRGDDASWRIVRLIVSRDEKEDELVRTQIVQSVEQAMRSFETAERALDAERLIGHFAGGPDFYIYNDGRRLTYDAVAAAVRSTYPTFRSITGGFSDVHVMVLAPDAALATARFQETVADAAGTKTRQHGAASWLWRQIDREWRIVYGHVDHHSDLP